MRKRILIVTNHSYMFWQFRRELAEALQKEYEMVHLHEPTRRKSFCRSKITVGL